MESTQPSKYDRWASNALFLAFGLSVVTNFFLKRGYFASDQHTKDYVTLYLITPLLLVVYYYIRKGLRGAKLFFLAVYGVLLFELITKGIGAVMASTPLLMFDFISQHILQATASIFIIVSFLRANNTKLATSAT